MDPGNWTVKVRKIRSQTNHAQTNQCRLQSGRAVLAALPNSHFYEMALMGPGMPNLVPPVYTNGYSDQPEDVAADGTVPVPDGPGLGVVYDWEFIEKNRTALHVFA